MLGFLWGLAFVDAGHIRGLSLQICFISRGWPPKSAISVNTPYLLRFASVNLFGGFCLFEYWMIHGSSIYKDVTKLMS